MIKALENPHFKKIWEEVNWKGRHPEAKSLEEALFLETYNTDCNVLHCGLNLIVSMQSLCLLRNSGFRLGDRQYHAFSQSFGRPITLENILLCIDDLKIHNLSILPIIKIYRENNIPEYYFDWQLTKPLHKQNPKTWEKISKLINK
jgi:hypothetical protein